jgi:hypothetical protein
VKRLIDNCPNCAAPLKADGYCEYCKTKIRYANEIEIDSIYSPQIELILKIKNKDEIVLIPCKGTIDNICISSEGGSYIYATAQPYSTYCTDKRLEFTFEGSII